MIHKNGSKCPYCKGQKFKEDDLLKEFNDKGYEVLDKITGKTSPIKVKCANGHIFTTSHHKMFTSGGRFTECFKCSYVTRYNTMVKLGLNTPRNQLSDLEIYRKEVWKVTNKNLDIENISLRGMNFHLDHIFSIKDGFKNNIPPYIIGNKINLRILDAKENKIKNGNSDFSLNELFDLFEGSTTIPKGSTLEV